MYYCSGTCGRKETARQTMRRRRADEHELKLAACRKALSWYLDLSPKTRSNIGPKWKREVAAKAMSALPQRLRSAFSIKAKFITDAINRGQLEMPP
jgi:hypothetical protein